MLSSNYKSSNRNVTGADDWELNRKMLCDMIGNNFEILEARDGRECMELIGEYGTEISLILLDDIMPGTDDNIRRAYKPYTQGYGNAAWKAYT